MNDRARVSQEDLAVLTRFSPFKELPDLGQTLSADIQFDSVRRTGSVYALTDVKVQYPGTKVPPFEVKIYFARVRDDDPRKRRRLPLYSSISLPYQPMQSFYEASGTLLGQPVLDWENWFYDNSSKKDIDALLSKVRKAETFADDLYIQLLQAHSTQDLVGFAQEAEDISRLLVRKVFRRVI